MKQTSAEKLLTVGEYPIDNQLDKKILASLMQVVAAIYNLEETIMKT
jgi:hypothetical protein